MQVLLDWDDAILVKNISTVLVQYWHLHDIGTKLHSLMRRHGCCLTGRAVDADIGRLLGPSQTPQCCPMRPRGDNFLDSCCFEPGFLSDPFVGVDCLCGFNGLIQKKYNSLI